MGMDYSIGKADVERARNAARMLMDYDGPMTIEFGGCQWLLKEDQTFALGCGMLVTLEILEGVNVGNVTDAVNAACRAFVEKECNRRNDVTRCKDCDYCNGNYCNLWHKYGLGGDHFCSYASKRIE